MRETKNNFNKYLTNIKNTTKDISKLEEQKKLICAKYNFYLKTLYRTSTNATSILLDTLAPTPPTKTPMSSSS